MKRMLREEYRLIKPALLAPWPWLGGLLGALWAYLQFMPNSVLPLAIFAFLLALQATIDLRTGLLAHLPTLLMALLGLAFSPLLGVGIGSSGAAILVAFALFYAMGFVAAKLAGRPALGGGDLLLVAGMAPWFGLEGIPAWLLAVAILGVIWLILRRAGVFPAQKGSGGKKSFAFGPVLAAAGWLAVMGQGVYWQCISFLAV